MKTVIVLICSLALAGITYGEQQQQKKQQPQKKQAQPAHNAAQPGQPSTARAKQSPAATHQRQNAQKGQSSTAPFEGQKGKKTQTTTTNERQTRNKKQTTTVTNQGHTGKNKQALVETQPNKAARGAQVNGQGKPTEARVAKTGKQSAAAQNTAKNRPVKPQHFNVPKQPNTAKAPPVKFQQGKRIQGSQNWQGQQYAAFRNYKEEWHDKNWWHRHYNRIVFVFGAPYYWNAGYWYPAWGYSPNAYYAWSGPIYAYNNMPPDQVIANVQATLQQQGYYHGDIDGLIGPLTRGALADYQRDHGLYMTSAIDRPTLESLGMA